MTDITDDDLLKAIQQALEQQPATEDKEPGTITSGELMDEFGLTRYRAKKTLVQLYKSGVLEKAYVNRFDGWGVTAVKGYKLKDAKP